MKATAVKILDALGAIAAIAKQPLDLESAEQVANFNEKLQPTLDLIEAERMDILNALRASEEGGEAERESGLKDADARLRELGDKEFEIPSISFGTFTSLKLTPEQVTFLKRLKVF